MGLEKNITVAFETAVAGGSLSVWESAVEIDGWSGTTAVSKAEDVLEGLFELLRKNNLSRHRIKTIAVATGAGSATGSKIGSATAKGLAKALGCRIIYVSLWDALAEAIRSGQSNQFIPFNIYLPGGKNTIHCREFVGASPSNSDTYTITHTINGKQLVIELAAYANTDRRLFAHQGVSRATSKTSVSGEFLLNSLGDNMAFYIGKHLTERV